MTPWTEVAETAATVPEIGVDLELRAQAMVLVARRGIGQKLTSAEAEAFCRRFAPPPTVETGETAAALVAAVEALIDQAEETRKPGTPETLLANLGALFLADLIKKDAPRLTERYGRSRIQSLLVAAHLLQGRGRILTERAQGAEDSFQEAEELASMPTSGRPWQTWNAPENLKARVRLEAVRGLYPAALGPQMVRSRFAKDVLNAATIKDLDEDRLIAAALGLQLAIGTKAPPIADGVIEASRAFLSSPLRCRAHADVPPAFIEAARLLGARGSMNKALILLESISRDADRFPIEVVRHAARAEAELLIAYQPERLKRPPEPLRESPELADRRLYWLCSRLLGRDAGPVPGSSELPDSEVLERLGRRRAALIYWREGRIAALYGVPRRARDHYRRCQELAQNADAGLLERVGRELERVEQKRERPRYKKPLAVSNVRPKGEPTSSGGEVAAAGSPRDLIFLLSFMLAAATIACAAFFGSILLLSLMVKGLLSKVGIGAAVALAAGYLTLNSLRRRSHRAALLFSAVEPSSKSLNARIMVQAFFEWRNWFGREKTFTDQFSIPTPDLRSQHKAPEDQGLELRTGP